MSEDWNAVAADVLEGLIEAGTGAEIIVPGVATGDAWNPTPGPPVAHACRIVFDTWRFGEVDGTLIRSTDLKVLVGAFGLSITPTAAHTLKYDGVEYAIIDSTPLRPAGVTVLYTVACRG